MDEMYGVKELKEWTAYGKKVAIFCAGQNGFVFYKILQLIGIEVDCFVDNNKEKWNKIAFDNVYCYSPEVLQENSEYLTYICISPDYYEEIRKRADELNILNIQNMMVLIKDIVKNYRDIYGLLLTELPYGKSSEFFYDLYPNRRLMGEQMPKPNSARIAVYTCVFGEYDAVWEPQYFSDNIDYYFVSDKQPSLLKGYKWINAEKLVPKEADTPIKKNRYVKMHPHLIFPEYEYSIYVDGNVQVIGDVSQYAQKSKTGISVFMHPWRDDFFVEALAVVNFKKAKAADVYRQISSYLEEGMPFDYGMAEMRLIAREHHNAVCIKLMEAWWKEFEMRPYRDQLSFMYIMWKNNYTLSDMFLLGDNTRKCDNILVHDHVCKSEK